MCFSQYSVYVPRPVTEEVGAIAVRPLGTPPSRAETDHNLFGPKPTPPGWQEAGHDHSNGTNGLAGNAVKVVGGGTSEITGVSTQTLEAVVVKLVNGTKLLICPL